MTLNEARRLDTEADPGTDASLDTEAGPGTATEPGKPGGVPTISLKNSALPLSWAKTDRRLIARRRARRDWYMLAIILLMLASAAACFYRLVWAMQP